MKGLFKVTYFHPREEASNVEAFNVIATSAHDAIYKANHLVSKDAYKPESVQLIAWVDR
jgi:hypothetical protein